ncbi:hypothetical protein H1R20_g9607, partial [Candolleomyces eurysporus]
MLRSERDAEANQSQPNPFKVTAFSNAIEAISQIRETIKSGDDLVLERKGIGLGIKNRINHYFVQQDLALARNYDQQQDALRRRAVIDLQKVPGIGRVKAQALVDAGCWNIASLIRSDQYHSVLTAQQKICLKYIDHLDKTTSREQAESVLQAVESSISPQYRAVLAGEYRRGLSDISTIVIMLIHSSYVHVPMPTELPPIFEDRATLAKRKNIIKKRERSSTLTKAARKTSLLHTEVLPSLKSKEIAFDTISETLSASEESSAASVASALQIPPGEYRRLVIHFMPQKSRATALLALTGDDDLNRYMRKRAERMGMLLNEYGLWKWNFSEPPKEPEADSLSSDSSEPSAGVSGGVVGTAAIGNVDDSSLLATGGYWASRSWNENGLITLLSQHNPTIRLGIMAHLTKPTTYNIEDSNIALLGSDLEKRVRENAGDHEPAWDNAGEEEGLKIWRVEQFHIVAWPEQSYGSFYDGDSYIVLYTYKSSPEAKSLSYNLHFWLGQNTSVDEAGTAAYKTVELDDHLHGKPVQFREVQGFESPQFLSYFPKFTSLKGGVSTGFHHVVDPPPLDILRLYRVTLSRLPSATTPGRYTNTLVVREVEPVAASLIAGDAYVLDKGAEVWQLNTKESVGQEKFKAAEFVQSLVDGRKGCDVTVFGIKPFSLSPFRNLS